MNDVHETFARAYLNEELTPAEWLRLDLGGRADFISFAVDNRLATSDPSAPKSGIDGAHQFSPKASAIVSPLAEQGAQLDVFLNYGHGFHSNDVRGVFSDAVGYTAHARRRRRGRRPHALWERFDFAATGWLLNLATKRPGTATTARPT